MYHEKHLHTTFSPRNYSIHHTKSRLLNSSAPWPLNREPSAPKIAYPYCRRKNRNHRRTSAMNQVFPINRHPVSPRLPIRLTGTLVSASPEHASHLYLKHTTTSPSNLSRTTPTTRVTSQAPSSGPALLQTHDSKPIRRSTAWNTPLTPCTK